MVTAESTLFNLADRLPNHAMFHYWTEALYSPDGRHPMNVPYGDIEPEDIIKHVASETGFELPPEGTDLYKHIFEIAQLLANHEKEQFSRDQRRASELLGVENQTSDDRAEILDSEGEN